jgi:phosphoesterase RecJ-like protein
MIMAVFSKIKVDQCLSKITEAKSIVIVAHKSPDGDSIGSSSALYSYLMKKGYKAKMVMPDPCPAFLDWLPGAESIVNADNHPDEAQSIIANADLIFCLDFNEVSRVGNVMQP